MGMTIDVVEALTKYKQNLIIRDRGQVSDKSVAEYSNLTMKEVIECLDFAIDTMRKYQQLEDFARWVATEVIDEEMWTYAFAELACRKLVKLGIMQESDGEYTYEVIEDGND